MQLSRQNANPGANADFVVHNVHASVILQWFGSVLIEEQGTDCRVLVQDFWQPLDAVCTDRQVIADGGMANKLQHGQLTLSFQITNATVKPSLRYLAQDSSLPRRVSS